LVKVGRCVQQMELHKTYEKCASWQALAVRMWLHD
jgi:hypothetical protein